MYEKQENGQLELLGFNQLMGMRLNPENRWVLRAERIPWEEYEQRYADLFAHRGKKAKTFRMALGSLIIQEEYGYTDAETVMQITESPYLQYFVGLKGYSDEPPFNPSMMGRFRQRITKEILEGMDPELLPKALKKRLGIEE